GRQLRGSGLDQAHCFHCDREQHLHRHAVTDAAGHLPDLREDRGWSIQAHEQGELPPDGLPELHRPARLSVPGPGDQRGCLQHPRARPGHLLQEAVGQGPLAMAFLPLLEEVVRSVDGALACSVMGFDGIAVENFQVESASDLDVQSTLVEYAAVLGQVRNAAQLLKTGAVTEVSINSDTVLTVMRLVTDEYFVVLALKASGNYGKGRYALRISAPRIRAEL